MPYVCAKCGFETSSVWAFLKHVYVETGYNVPRGRQSRVRLRSLREGRVRSGRWLPPGYLKEADSGAGRDDRD